MALPPLALDWTTLHYTTLHTTSFVCQLLKETGLGSSGGDSSGDSLTGSTLTIAMRLLTCHERGRKPSLCYKIQRRDELQEQNGNAVLHPLGS